MRTFKPLVIVKAWINVFKGVTTEEHRRRANICKPCKHSKYGSYLDFRNDELHEVQGLYCNDCGCPLVAKIRSTDICKKWQQHTK